MDRLTMPISSNLKTLRANKELTQGELADLAGIELAQISRIERGTTQPKLETIKKLAIALKCSADDLIFDDEEKTLSSQLKALFDKVEKLRPVPKNQLIAVMESYCMWELMNEGFREQTRRTVPPAERDEIDRSYMIDEVMLQMEKLKETEATVMEQKKAIAELQEKIK